MELRFIKVEACCFTKFCLNISDFNKKLQRNWCHEIQTTFEKIFIQSDCVVKHNAAYRVGIL